MKEINEWFENRKDKMFKRVRIVLGGVNRFIESYHPGGAGEIKQWTHYPGKSIEVDYHVSGRLDRLVRRVETVAEKIVEHFAGRTDSLIYRSVHFTADSNLVGTRQFLLGGVALVPPLYIMKMTQKYEVNKTLPATESSLAKRVFYVKEGKAVATYHFKDGEITSQVKTYFYSKGVGVSIMSKQAYLQELGVVEDPVLLQEVALLERECYSSAKLVYQQILTIDSVRAESEKKVINEKNIFEIALEKADKLDIAQQGMISEGGVETGPKGLNYLTPYLRKFKNKEFSELTREEAIEIRQNCLDALRSRLVERSNIIQSRLNDENSKLGLQQAIFQRTHTERNEDLLPTDTVTKTESERERERERVVEEYQKYCTEAMFRIQILERRLSTHEGAALKKFAELDARLAADERLRVLWPTTSII